MGDSAYAMSQRIYYIFIVILFLLITIPVVFFAFRHTFIGFIWLFVFFMGSALAVYFFVSNLFKLAALRNRTMSKACITAEEISLDRFQQKMIDLAARYLLLFGVATLSSLLFTLGGLFVSSLWGIPVAIAFCINLLCMALQF